MQLAMILVECRLLCWFLELYFVLGIQKLSKMGIRPSQLYREGNKPPTLPDSFSAPTFDPEYGFKYPRVQRESKISEQEMKALRIHKKMRDYCAHYWKDFLVCNNHYKPMYWMCNPEFHAYEHCQIEDYILRMKEFEREKRLRIRAEKKRQKEAS